MKEDELCFMLERLIEKTSVFNLLFTHLGSFVNFNSCATFKVYKMTPEAEDTRWCTMKQAMRLFAFSLVFCFCFTGHVNDCSYNQPGLRWFLYFFVIFVFSLTCLEHKIDGVYCIWKIHTILEKLA